MRTRLLLPALLLLSSAAAAQVTVDPRALDPSAPATPAPPTTTPARPAPKPVPRRQPAPVHPAPAHPAPATTSTTTTTVRPNLPPTPGVPLAPPPGASLPPPIVVPMRPAPPTPPATVTADAPDTAVPLPGGVRVTFGTGRFDLNPASEQAIRALVRGPGPAGSISYTITSYAAGTPEDPSTPRRISLSRALGVRSVLIGQGVNSVRIYVKALGPASQGFADGPPDRADVIVAANPIPAPAATPATPTDASPGPPPKPRTP